MDVDTESREWRRIEDIYTQAKGFRGTMLFIVIFDALYAVFVGMMSL